MDDSPLQDSSAECRAFSSKSHMGYSPAFLLRSNIIFFLEAKMNTDVFPSLQIPINLSDLYDAKTMYSDHVSSHCYYLSAFPLI